MTRKIYVLFILLYSLLLICPAIAQAQTDRCKAEEFRAGEAERWQQQALFKEHSDKEFNYNVRYYRTYWQVDPRQFYIQGSVTTYFTPNEDKFSRMKFDMNSDLTVDSIIFHGNKKGWTLDKEDILTIEMGATVPQGQLDSIQVYYQGAPINGNGSFIQTDHLGEPVLWTLSEPFGAKDWWPCKQSLEDKADSVDIYVQAPKPNKVGSNGLLVEQWEKDTMITYHWMHRYPIVAYLVGIAVAPYTETRTYIKTSATDSFLMLDYFYKPDSARLAPEISTTADIMHLFIEKFGPYPFDKEKYGHAQFDFSGGMEHQTMSFMRNLGFTLVAHELAHHWFGNKVTCGSWEDIWLNEGFASFCESMAIQRYRSHEELLKWRKEEINYVMTSPAGSVKVPDSTNKNRIFDGRLTYSKGGLVVQMLNYIMGDSAFYKAIRNYMSDPKLAYGFAKTPDLKAHLEAVYGKSLDQFFQEWYEGEGYPAYDLGWSMNNNKLTVYMQQTTTSGFVRLYHIPVPLKVWRSGQDTTVYIAPEKNIQNFQFDLPGNAIDSIEADPEYLILAKYKIKAYDTIPHGEPAIYPNPAGAKVYIDLKRNGPQLLTTIDIYDTKGRLVLQRQGALPNLIELDTRGLSKGLYIVKVRNADISYTGKFVKVKD